MYRLMQPSIHWYTLLKVASVLKGNPFIVWSLLHTSLTLAISSVIVSIHRYTHTQHKLSVLLTQRSPVLFWPFFHIWRTRHKKETPLHRSIWTWWRPPGRAWRGDISLIIWLSTLKHELKKRSLHWRKYKYSTNKMIIVFIPTFQPHWRWSSSLAASLRLCTINAAFKYNSAS